MASSVEQVVNQALVEAGRTKRIAYIYEGSEEAKVAIELYGQTRDELLRATDWSFSRKVLALTLLKGPPPDGGYSFASPWTTVYPYQGFLYEYAYPSDCLDLRAIVAPPGSMPDLDPLPALWRVDNDPVPIVTAGVAGGPPAKVILCNTTNAQAVYRAQITSPSLWEPGFTAALVASLSAKFAKAFGLPGEVAKEDVVEALGTARGASETRG